MSDRAAASAALERSLYAYVFDEDVSDRFRGYREQTRRERFRHHYTVQLAERMHALLPQFVAEVGPPRAEDVARLRVELPGDRSLVQTLAGWEPLALATAARHPRPALARELFWLDRARALALSQAPAEREVLLAALDELARQQLGRPQPEHAGVVDHPPIFHVLVRSSVPELLAMPLGRAPALEAAARTPWARHCVSYRSAVDGRLHRKCARSFERLRELVADCRGGVDP